MSLVKLLNKYRIQINTTAKSERNGPVINKKGIEINK